MDTARLTKKAALLCRAGTHGAVFAAVLLAVGSSLIVMSLRADRATLCGAVPRQGEMGEFNKMAAGRYIDTSHGPVYPLFLMAVRGISGGANFRAVFLAQALALACGAVMAFAAASRLGGRAAAAVAGTLTIAYPGFILYGMVTLPLAFCLSTVFLLALVISREMTDRRKAAAAALTAAFGVMLEPSFIFFVPGTALALKRRGLFMLVFMVAILPWGVRNSVVAGRVVPLYEISGFGMDADRLSDTFSDGWKLVEQAYHDLSFLTKRSGEKSYMPVLFGNRADNDHLIQYSYVILMLLGLTGLVRRVSRVNAAMVYPFAGYLLLTILLVKYTVRYRVPLEPVLVIFASLQLVDLFNMARRRIRPSG